MNQGVTMVSKRLVGEGRLACRPPRRSGNLRTERAEGAESVQRRLTGIYFGRVDADLRQADDRSADDCFRDDEQIGVDVRSPTAVSVPPQ